MFLLPFSLFEVDFVDLFSPLVFLDYISPFNICFKAGLVVLNSLNFCLSEKLFISSSILNEIPSRYSNLGCRFFPFHTLNISYHSLLACRVSAERSAVKRMGFPLYVTCCFSLPAFNILSLCLVFVRRDEGAWWAAIHGVARSRTRLSDFTFTFIHWRRKWQPTPVFLAGESQGRGSLVGCRLWGRTKSDTTEVT